MGKAKKIIAGVVAVSLAAGGAAGGLSYAKKHNIKPVNVCSVSSLQYEDYMPDEVRHMLDLAPRTEAIAGIHFPETKETLLVPADAWCGAEDAMQRLAAVYGAENVKLVEAKA